MAFCTYCGTQIVEGGSFCPNCGKPVKSVAPAPAQEASVAPNASTAAPAGQGAYAGYNYYLEAGTGVGYSQATFHLGGSENVGTLYYIKSIAKNEISRISCRADVITEDGENILYSVILTRKITSMPCSIVAGNGTVLMDVVQPKKTRDAIELHDKTGVTKVITKETNALGHEKIKVNGVEIARWETKGLLADKPDIYRVYFNSLENKDMIIMLLAGRVVYNMQKAVYDSIR